MQWWGVELKLELIHGRFVMAVVSYKPSWKPHVYTIVHNSELWSGLTISDDLSKSSTSWVSQRKGEQLYYSDLMLIHNSLGNVIKDKSLDYWMILVYYDEYASGKSMLIEYVS